MQAEDKKADDLLKAKTEDKKAGEPPKDSDKSKE